MRIIDPDLTKICQKIQEILLVAQTYLPGFEKGKIHVAESSVYYMKMATADADEGWTRHFDLYEDFSQLKKVSLKRRIDYYRRPCFRGVIKK